MPTRLRSSEPNPSVSPPPPHQPHPRPLCSPAQRPFSLQQTRPSWHALPAATATLPPPPGTSLGAAVNGPDGCRPPGLANAATLPHPSPSTAPVRQGLVPQCGQEPGTWGDTPRPVALSHSGRRRAVLTSRWPWASDGPFAERRIVGPCRHWRSRRTLSGGGPSRRCRWRIAVGAVHPRGREAVQPGPLVRRQLGGLSEPDRQRRAAASAAGTPGRAQPVSYRMHPRGVARGRQ
jgi:hypothetical protein